jgi:hypothetical protein
MQCISFCNKPNRFKRSVYSSWVQEVLGTTNSPTFPTCHLLEVLEPNLMQLNLSELTLTSFNSI